jgi:predicted transcriptional regulator
MDPVLAPWGFGDRDETVYRAILRRPGATVDELALELGLPRDVVLRAARKLIRNRLVRRRGDGVAALRPDLALATLVERAEDELAERRSNIQHVEDTITQFMHDHLLGERDSGAPPGIEPVSGTDAMAAVITDLVREHTGEVVSLVAPPVPEVPAPLVMARVAAASSRRLQARSVHAADSLDGNGARAAAELEARGAVVRVAPRVPLKVLLFSGRAALIKADPACPQVDELLVVRAPALVAALGVMFELVWERATPLRQVADGAAVPDTGLLELLAAGCQDEQIAAQLGISVRTVRRRVAELLESLGARTRFQAGAQAARRGLFPR